MKRYGITIIEMEESQPAKGLRAVFPKPHKEEEIYRQIIPEKDFNLRSILRAILKGGNGNGKDHPGY